MAIRGKDNLIDFIKDTISEHVINRATCPALVVSAKKRAS